MSEAEAVAEAAPAPFAVDLDTAGAPSSPFDARGEWSKRLSARLAPLSGRVDAARQGEVDALTATLTSAPPCSRIRQTAAQFRDEVKATTVARQRIINDGTLSPQGREMKLAELAQRHASTVDALGASAAQALAGIARTGDARRVPLTPEQSAHIAMLWSRVDKQTAPAVLDHAADDLAIALDDTQSGNARYDANVRLRDLHGPWLARVDEAPPPHYREHAASVVELRMLVDSHVDVALGGYRQRAAEAFAESIRSEWTYARGSAAQEGAFDDFTMSIGSPRLYGHLRPR